MKKALIIIFSIGLIIAIGFGTAAYFEVKKLANQPSNPLDYNKDYKNEDAAIKKLKLESTFSDVKIVRGDHFKVEAVGGNKEQVRVESEVRNDTLVVRETHRKQTISINFRGYDSADVTITVPDRMLDKVNVKNDTSDVYVNGLKAKDTNIVSGSGDIKVKDSVFDKLNLESDSGDIQISKSIFKDVITNADSGTINLKSIDGDANIRANSDSGDIQIEYAKAPKNTKVINRTNEDTGSDVHVNQPDLKAKRYGQGEYILEVDTSTGTVSIN